MSISSENNANCGKKIIIPDGFRELLQDLAVEVLRNQPNDILDFSIGFLTERKKTQSEGVVKKKLGMAIVKNMAPNTVVMKIGVLSPEKVILDSGMFTNVNKTLLENFNSDILVKKALELNEELNISMESDEVYFLQSGKLYVFEETSGGRQKVAELNWGGAYFGDFAGESLVVVAKTPSKLISVKKKDLNPAILEFVKKRREEFKEFIDDMDLFQSLSDFSKRVVIDSMIEKVCTADEEIFQEGDAGSEMFLVYEGFISIQRSKKEINSVSDGGYFGELAVLEGEPRAASAVAISETKLFSININVVKNIIEHACKTQLDKQIKGYYNTENNEDDESESEMETPQFEKVNLPRKSVSAGKYNPEMDDDEDDEDMFEGINSADLIKTEEQRENLRKCCKNILLFRCLDEEQLEVVIDSMFQKVSKPGDVIIKRGDDGDNFYVVDHGIFDIIVPVNDVDTVVAQYKNEGSFGELALMYNTPRSATVIAKTDGLLWAMNREMFRKIVLKKAFQKRLMYENLLAQVPIFKNISTYERTNVADALRSRVYEAGAMIIKQDDEGHDMFFIEEGIVEIFVDYKNGNEPEMLGELERGKYFGEMALINHKPRAATISAKNRCKIAVLDRESFERLLGPCIEVMKRIMKDYGTATLKKK